MLNIRNFIKKFLSIFKNNINNDTMYNFDKQILDFIKKWEGCSLSAYQCSAGVWTIGYGNTFYEDGSKVKSGDIITQDRADELLIWYLHNNCKLPDLNLNSNQKTAIYSFQYNLGLGNWNKSTLKKMIESNNIEGIKKEWLKYNTAGGKVLDGLTKRRESELKLFLS